MGKHDRPFRNWFLNSFFLHIRHSFVPLFCVLLLLCNATCSLSMSDLRYSNGHAEVVYICDKPLDVPDDVDMWALNSMTGQLVTGEDPAELRYFASSADLFFEYDADAPLSSIAKMPPEYGLTCVKSTPSFPNATASFFPPSSELFRSKEPCPAKLTETAGRVDRLWLAAPGQGKTPCETPKKEPMRVHVCVRPPGVGDVREWGMVDVKGIRTTRSEKEFQEQVTNAKIVFVFDENTIPESVYWFVQDAKKLSCSGKPPPKPYDQVIGSGMLEVINAATAMASALKGGEPKKGDGKTTETSSPDGQGPPLDFLETLVHNADIFAALAAGNTSGKLNDSNGARHGTVNGTNVGGSDLLAVQAAAATFSIIGIPFKSSKDFLARMIRAVKRGKTPTILDPNVLTKELAEKLAEEPTEKAVEAAKKALAEGEEVVLESFGKAMAIALRDAGVILPYSRAQIFTRGWGGKFQAHHALEVDMGKNVLNMGTEAIDNIPAIILTDAQHKLITKNLNDVRNKILAGTGQKYPDKQQLWKIYQEVYKDYPAWLKAIKGYFPSMP